VQSIHIPSGRTSILIVPILAEKLCAANVIIVSKFVFELQDATSSTLKFKLVVCQRAQLFLEMQSDTRTHYTSPLFVNDRGNV